MHLQQVKFANTKDSDDVTKNNDPKISRGLLVFLAGISLFFIIVTSIVILTGNARWAIIAVVILIILLVVSKIIALIILTKK